MMNVINKLPERYCDYLISEVILEDNTNFRNAVVAYPTNPDGTLIICMADFQLPIYPIHHESVRERIKELAN